MNSKEGSEYDSSGKSDNKKNLKKAHLILPKRIENSDWEKMETTVIIVVIGNSTVYNTKKGLRYRGFIPVF